MATIGPGTRTRSGYVSRSVERAAGVDRSRSLAEVAGVLERLDCPEWPSIGTGALAQSLIGGLRGSPNRSLSRSG